MTLLERLGGREAITRGIVHTFRILSRRPRPSRHEEAAGEELDAYLRGLGLSPVRDGAGNRMADVPPAPGRASAPRLILQGHLDMVCAVRPGSGWNPLTDPVAVVEEGAFSVRTAAPPWGRTTTWATRRRCGSCPPGR